MDLSKSGKLICELRKSKKMTQKQVADILGIEAKTVFKWETGRGFPDVSYVSELADIFGVSEKILLSGNLIQNTEEVGNMKKIKFYVCPRCGSIIQGTGEYEVICCGSKLDALKPQQPDDSHTLNTAMKTGTAQYVILGSGLDTFLLRCGKNNIDIFEIDKEDVIADKKCVLTAQELKSPIMCT